MVHILFFVFSFLADFELVKNLSREGFKFGLLNAGSVASVVFCLTVRGQKVTRGRGSLPSTKVG